MGDYPFIQVPHLSGGMVVAIVAVIHIILAHYAVGAGFLLYGLESFDQKGDKKGIQRALDILGFTIIYVNLILGALTGVGIWFTISLFSPSATEHLIQKFVWLWATEWTFFVLEIGIAYYYYYNRDVFSPANRRYLARIYMLVSWATLILITGILSYMLTSKTGNALESWWNPSFLPSVFIRTVASISLACLVMMFLVNIEKIFDFKHDSEEKKEVFQAIYPYLDSYLLLFPAVIWFFFSIPTEAATYVAGGSIPISMFFGLAAFLSVIIAMVSLYGNKFKKVLELETTFFMLLLWLVATSCCEFVREGIRKPYLIRPVLYSNGMLKADYPQWQKKAQAVGSILLVNNLSSGKKEVIGTASATKSLPEKSATELKVVGRFLIPEKFQTKEKLALLTPQQRGKYIYMSQCSSCHTRMGFNALLHLTGAWNNKSYVMEFLKNMHLQKSYMPPFVGTSKDMDDLRAFFLKEFKGKKEGSKG
ncbi:c-type cytochrome [Candidatus Riflebacteria bacterium]